MRPEDVTRFARRDWDAIDASKTASWLEERRRRGVRWCFEVADGLVDIGGLVVPVIGPEELIVTKILAARPKDLDDVQGILQAQAEALDLERVRELLGLLEAALDQADLLPCLEEQVRVARRCS